MPQVAQPEETVLWISGATEGIGLGLARNAPYPNTRVINLSRRPHPDYESVVLDLTDPNTWELARESFERELKGFAGRAIFIHNAYYSNAVGLVGRVDRELYKKSVIGNVAAGLVLGEAFISACPPHIESGLVMMSSGSAVAPLEGLATYCAAKVAVEHWVEVVKMERVTRGGEGPWVVAVRPGGVDTAPARTSSTLDPRVYPRAGQVKKNFGARLDIDTAARRIWNELPPAPETAVVTFEAGPPGLDLRFGNRTKFVAEEDWRRAVS
jgi:NAD(P)-dependent dehydrogenase (short-subunit alcohol dehydrogenase family)